MQAVLVMIRSDGERRSFSIARDMTVVGRREDCDLRIPLGEISRKHCRMVREGDSLRLEDLGSSNGTFHNGERIQEAVLGAGDTIQIGPVVFVLQVDGFPADEDIQPVATQAIEGGGTDIGGEVTEGAYAADPEAYAEEGEGSSEPQGEFAAEGEYAAGSDYSTEGESVGEPERATEGELPADGQFASAEDLFLTEEHVDGESNGNDEFVIDTEAPVEESDPLAQLGGAPDSHEGEGFASLEAPETPHELHLENHDLDAQQPNG